MAPMVSPATSIMKPLVVFLLIAQLCLAYISYLDLAAALLDSAPNDPLLHYASHYWYYHMQRSGAYNEELARLVEEVLKVRWDIYRLVIYPNILTRYNPWVATQVSTLDRGRDTEQSKDLSTVCHSTSYHKLQSKSGMRYKTYVALKGSAHMCRLCRMLYCALLWFGVARHC